jgi:hypothetical protein
MNLLFNDNELNEEFVMGFFLLRLFRGNVMLQVMVEPPLGR